MLLTICTTRPPATDLGYLLHKHPQRRQAWDLGWGQAHVFYTEATTESCTAALLVEVDALALRQRRGGRDFALGQYVNDRPYVASSLLSVAIGRVFGSALKGRCEERPQLAQSALPLEARIEVLPCRDGEALLKRLFEPLGYGVEARAYGLDPDFPQWGDSPYYSVGLKAEVPLSRLLNHLYVLVPVLDEEKHYYVGEEEIEKLLSHGEGWLAGHPERELIASRYLKHQRGLRTEALGRLSADEPAVGPGTGDEEGPKAPASLKRQRQDAVLEALRGCGARRVLDLGCGDGELLQRLLQEVEVDAVMGMDVSPHVLERARTRLDRLPWGARQRLRLVQGSLLYRDRRLAGYDAAVAAEVVEHIEPERLPAFEAALLGTARPVTLILTTPNAEYNAVWQTLPAGDLRHEDHRFEWTRTQFEDWALAAAGRHGYAVCFAPVGPVDAKVGAPTQMAVFGRQGAA